MHISIFNYGHIDFASEQDISNLYAQHDMFEAGARVNRFSPCFNFTGLHDTRCDTYPAYLVADGNRVRSNLRMSCVSDIGYDMYLLSSTDMVGQSKNLFREEFFAVHFDADNGQPKITPRTLIMTEEYPTETDKSNLFHKALVFFLSAE